MHPIDDRTWPDKMKCDYCGEEHAKYGGQPSNKSWNEFVKWAENLSKPFWCLVILWQDKWDYFDSIHEYLKKRNGGKRADW